MADHVPSAARLPTSIPVPEDGKKPTGAVLGGPHRVGFDAIKFLQDLVSPGGDGEIITRMAGVPLNGTNATIYSGIDGDGKPTPRVVCTATFQFVYMLDLPHGAGLRQIRAYLYQDDVTLTSVSIAVVRRSYASTIDVGDIAFVPEETVIDSDSSAPSAMTGGMSSISATFSAETVDRDDSADYFARVSGVISGGGAVLFMPKVRQWVQLIDIDKGAA